LFNGVLDFRHFQSVTPKEISFEVTRAFASMGTLRFEDYNFALVYAGDPILKAGYDILLEGVPDDVLLNPLQREYVEDVTMQFLELFSDVEPYQVNVFGQNIERRRNLRAVGRDLQSTGVVSIQAGISGIGPDEKEYFDLIEEAFDKSGDMYRELLVKQQFRPSQINDEQDFGVLFANLAGVSVIATGNTPSSSGGGSEPEGDGLTKTQIQIIIFSAVLALSVCLLCYRLSLDCFCVAGSDRAKTKKLTRNQAKDEAKREGKMSADRPELQNMDLAPKAKPVPEQSRPTARGRSRSPSRGVAVSKSSGSMGAFFGSSKPTPEAPSRGRSRSPSAPTRGRSQSPSRGVQRKDFKIPSKSSSAHDRSFMVPSKAKSSSSHDRSLTVPSKAKSSSSHDRSFTVPSKAKSSSSHDMQIPPPSRPEPTRGVAKSSTFGGYDGFFGKPSSSATPTRPSWASRSQGETIPRGTPKSEMISGSTVPPRPPPPPSTSTGTKSKKDKTGKKKNNKDKDDSTRSARTAGSSKSGKSKSSKASSKTGASPKNPKSPKAIKEGGERSPKTGKKNKKMPPKKKTSTDSASVEPKQFTSSQGKRPNPPPTRVDMIGVVA
jgi:hypothetical protein